MTLCPKRTILLPALAFCVVFSIFSAETLNAANLDHDCIGEANDCRICLQIEAANCFLKTFGLAGIVLFFAARLMFPAQTPQKDTGFNFYPLSPIALKVRFNT